MTFNLLTRNVSFRVSCFFDTNVEVCSTQVTARSSVGLQRPGRRLAFDPS